MDEQQTDFILLYIDNEEPALNAAITNIKSNIDKAPDIQVYRFKRFVTREAPYIIKDWEIRRLLRAEIRNAPASNDYWTGVYNYYLAKYKESKKA